MTMLWILLVVALLLVILRMMFRWKNRRLVAVQKQLALDGIDLPFIGHIYKFMGSDEDRMKAMAEFGKEAYRKTGCVAEFQGPYLFVLVADPEAADVLLKTCLEKIDLVRMFRVLLGNGSIFAPVSIWRPRRKILAPTFSQKNLNSFVNVFSQQSSIMGDQLRKVAGKGVFSVWKYLTTYTMDSVCETTLGIQVRSQMEPELPFLQAFENCCQIDAKRIFQPWRYNDTVNKIIYNRAFKSYARSKEMMWKFMHKIIASKWEDLKKQKQLGSAAEAHTNNWKTFLQMLIESEAGYGDVELREETLVLVLAGTDTSAVGSAFTLMMLAKYPDVQDKVYEELQEIFGNSDRPVTHEDLPRLKYLDAVIKESLRLYPPVPIITRRVEKDVTLPSGVTLVEGCNLLIFIWSIHRNPKYWGDDADLFRPERFIDAPPMHPAAFMPFSYGPRSCLGYQYAMMSMKTALAVLLRRYRVISSERKNGKNETNDHRRKPNLRVQFDIMLKHVDNFEIQLELRK